MELVLLQKFPDIAAETGRIISVRKVIIRNRFFQSQLNMADAAFMQFFKNLLHRARLAKIVCTHSKLNHIFSSCLHCIFCFFVIKYW